MYNKIKRKTAKQDFKNSNNYIDFSEQKYRWKSGLCNVTQR